MSISVTMNASMDARKTLGFDHMDGAAKDFKSKSSLSRQLKAAHIFGRTLDELSHDETAKHNRRRNKKVYEH